MFANFNHLWVILSSYQGDPGRTIDMMKFAEPVVASEFKLLWTKTSQELNQDHGNFAQVEELFIHYKPWHSEFSLVKKLSE